MDLKQHYLQLRNAWNNLQRELAGMLTLFLFSCILYLLNKQLEIVMKVLHQNVIDFFLIQHLRIQNLYKRYF